MVQIQEYVRDPDPEFPRPGSRVPMARIQGSHGPDPGFPRPGSRVPRQRWERTDRSRTSVRGARSKALYVAWEPALNDRAEPKPCVACCHGTMTDACHITHTHITHTSSSPLSIHHHHHHPRGFLGRCKGIHVCIIIAAQSGKNLLEPSAVCSVHNLDT